ncbi:uncharacterized protein B0H18DRAFT_420627 [Fomitopsis serialis]|uniref:uncharacterized protein n=1 Tax=Fomitopsis serialis TaxID=139415 RepID=UPI00200867FD|nr:uncharacterized protein B0H18DRAFT_420627 [Neoantrodia serialis]KAH9935696.1 hypothetical protein B0H18DRAFT_420627 [Neoantrodia serialis]
MCEQSSPMVYAEQWMCLYRKCLGFWRSAQGHAPTQLTYARSFLHPIAFAPEDLEELRPSPPVAEAEDGITTSSMFCKGWHCRQCGRLSSRYMWEHWHCKHCGGQYKVAGRVRDSKEFWTQPSPQSFTNHVVATDSGSSRCPCGYASWVLRGANAYLYPPAQQVCITE